MALHPHQAQVGENIRNNRIFATFEAAMDGTISLVRYKSDTAVVNGVNFNLKINGVSIYPTLGDRPAIAHGDFEVEQVEDSPVVRGDKIELSAALSGSFGHVGSKLYATMYIQDGLPTTYAGTSTTSLAIATGTKVFTTQAGLGYVVGTRARAASDADPTNFMEGIVTAYSGTSLTILVDVVGGSGTYGDWNLSVAGQRGVQGPAGDDGPPGTGGNPLDFGDHFIHENWAQYWRAAGTGGGSVFPLTPVAGHPGILRCESNSGSFNVVGIGYQTNNTGYNFLADDDFDVTWYCRPVDNDSDVIYRIGIFNANFNGSINDAIFFHKEGASSEFKGQCISSSSSTQTAGFGAYTANTWHTFRIRRVSSGVIGFTYDGGTELTITTNIPTVPLVVAAYVVRVNGTKTLDLDYVTIRLN